MKTYQHLQLELDATVASVYLNRPTVRNAFNEVLIAELAEVFTALVNDAAVRVIVLGARGQSFCAGADLHWMQKTSTYTEDENRADAARLAELLAVIDRCPKPVIARVQGACFAGGLGLVAACDVAVAASASSFCLSEVKLGLIPAIISPYVVRAMGVRAARRYFLTAEKFSALEAQHMGLIHIVTDGSGLDCAVQRLVKAFLAGSPTALKAAKELLHDLDGAPLSDALIADTVARIAAQRASSEGREGVAAFLEKRKPKWTL